MNDRTRKALADREALDEARRRRKREEAARKEWLRVQKSRPRTKIPAQYGETIHVHEKILDRFMKQVGQKIDIETYKVAGGAGSSLTITYTTRYGGRGELVLNDLGPMPIG
ncbi:hypothetical protein ACTHPH_23920 [Paenibacillus pasadenensis]|uniref:Uncharacterized protein n=1 Tax=Paenibacillus albicereus TaxID=2726185 RepID=A0A6H2H0F4_9BACL|nr:MULTISPECIES: hypothetical protein [Paenibacillus]QJC53079.1 hypothetical protein HGI30_16855 [Paenibacillus albicereus]